jgi:Flp pilus assembly protein TadD
MIFSKASRVTIAALATLLSACAVNVRPDVSSLLVKQGKPSVSYDVADPGKGEASKTGSPDSRESAVREHVNSGLTVEGTDKALAAALATLRKADTVENRLRVAAEYRRLRILDKAFDLVTGVLKLDHRSAEALEQRAQIWREWGFAPLGLTDAYRAVFIAPRSASARNTLGTLLQSLGNVEGARRAYENAAKLDPKAAYAWSNLCYLSLLTRNADRAITECHVALRLDPRDAAIRNNIALSYAAAGRPQEARAELLTNGSPADAAYNIGMLYLALGSYQLAEESFRTATDMRPNFTAAQTRRRQAARAAATTNPYDYSNRP